VLQGVQFNITFLITFADALCKLLRSSTGGNYPNTYFDQSDVSLRCRLCNVGVKRHLAATSKGSARRATHYGDRRISYAHDGVLEGPHHEVELIVVLLNRIHEHKPEVGAKRKVRSLMPNHEPAKILFGNIDGLVQTFHDRRTECVTLAVPRKVDHTVAEI